MPLDTDGINRGESQLIWYSPQPFHCKHQSMEESYSQSVLLLTVRLTSCSPYDTPVSSN